METDQSGKVVEKITKKGPSKRDKRRARKLEEFACSQILRFRCLRLCRSPCACTYQRYEICADFLRFVILNFVEMFNRASLTFTLKEKYTKVVYRVSFPM